MTVFPQIIVQCRSYPKPIASSQNDLAPPALQLKDIFPAGSRHILGDKSIRPLPDNPPHKRIRGHFIQLRMHPPYKNRQQKRKEDSQ
jgi:hypothetical protein